MQDGKSETGFLLFAHGSRVAEANEGVHELARRVQASGSLRYVRAAFLELASPDLATAIGEAVAAGMQRILVIPYFLTMGVHLRRDLPRLITQARERFAGVEIEAAESLEDHPLMPSLILDRIQSFSGKSKVLL